MVEKTLNLHCTFVWTMRNNSNRDWLSMIYRKFYEQQVPIVSNVLVFKAQDFSRKSSFVESKPSLSGTNCAKMFNPNTLPRGSDIVNESRNFIDSSGARKNQLKMSMVLDNLRQYFIHLTLRNDQISQFMEKVEQ